MTTIIPYEAIGSLRFGMSQNEVTDVIGIPATTAKDRRGNIVLRYGDKIVTIADDGLVEVGFLPEATISICGVSAFSDPDAFEKLCQIDGDPKEALGFIVLLNIGITMTGFHDLDESQKAVTAFARGRWDVLRSEMKSFRLPRQLR